MSTIADLDRRMSRKIEGALGMQLTPSDLDLLVASGAYAAIRQAALKYQEGQCRARNARNRSINGATTGSMPGPVETMKSSGMTPPPDVSEALAQVQALFGKRA